MTMTLTMTMKMKKAVTGQRCITIIRNMAWIQILRIIFRIMRIWLEHRVVLAKERSSQSEVFKCACM
jgi:hypothetical protein